MNTFSRNVFQTVLIGAATLGLGLGASAAVDGSVGFNSTGSVDISLTVNDEVRISNLTDINLGVFGGADAIGSSDACVYRNGTGAYRITASGSGAGGAFSLTDGTNSVGYAVEFDDGTGAVAMGASTPMIGRTGADATSATCATTGNNATVTTTVTATDAASLPAGTYTGTLTLLVAPE
ncbi:MAG: hypothetical protein AB8G17_16515 [Gammaproteobacteria bacterium]